MPRSEVLGNVAAFNRGFGSRNKSLSVRGHLCPGNHSALSALVPSVHSFNLGELGVWLAGSHYRGVVLHGIAGVLEEGVLINTRYLYGKQAGEKNRDVRLIGLPLLDR